MRSSARYAVPTFLIVLCFAASGFAQSQTKQPVKTSRASVSGRITIKDKPAPGVAVGLRRSDAGTPFEPYSKATTDQNGEYRFANLAPGNYDITPAAPGYVSADANNARGKNIVVGEDESVEAINFSLVRGGVITGKITDADGRPVIQQQVNLYRVDDASQPPQLPNQPPRPMFPVSTGQTDDRGIYRVFGLAAGRYKVSAGRGDETFTSFAMGQISYKQVFHPDVSDAAKATIIEVSEGSEANNVDITLGRTLQTFAVSGRVVDESGAPVPNIRFGFQRMMGQRTEFMSTMATSNLRGDFTVEGLVSGKYSIFLFPNANLDMRAETTTFDVFDQDVTGVTIRLAKGVSVSGVVVLEIDDKAAQQKLSELQLRGFVMSSPGFGTSATSQIAPDGSFRLGGLSAGTLNLSLGAAMAAYPPKGFALARIERDGIVMPRLELKDGEQVIGVKVFVSYGTATVRGVVNLENGSLPEGARIFLRLAKQGEINAPQRPPQIDARGHFLIEGVPAGVYELTANIVGPNIKLPRPVKRDVSLSDGVITDVTLTIDLSTLTKP